MRQFVLPMLFNLLSLSLSAQTFLTYGDNHRDRIANYGEVDTFLFEGVQGDLVWIRMRDETKVDAYIRVYNPDGSLLAKDWSDGGLAEIQSLELPVSGQFTIKAYDRNHNDIGNYGISLHKINAPDYALALSNLTNLTDSIRRYCAINTYSFMADEGDKLYIQMRALTEHMESDFFIYDSEGFLVKRSIRSGASANSTLLPITKTDEYTLFVLDKGGNDRDTYGLSFQLVNKHRDAPLLACGNTIVADIEHLAARNAYQLIIPPGRKEWIQVRGSHPSLEAILEIYNSMGELIYQETGSDRLITTQLTSKEDESFLVVISDKHGNDLAGYGLHCESLINNICAQNIPCSETGSISYSITETAQLKAYKFLATAGEPYDFEVREQSSSLEPQIQMFFQGELVDEHSGSQKASCNGIFQHTGEYIVLIGDRSGNDMGPMELVNFEGEIKIGLFSPFVNEEYHTNCNYFGGGTIRTTVTGGIAPYQYSWNNGMSESSLISLSAGTYEVTISDQSGCANSAKITLKQPESCGCVEPESVDLCSECLNLVGSTGKKLSGEKGCLPNDQSLQKIELQGNNSITLCDDYTLDQIRLFKNDSIFIQGNVQVKQLLLSHNLAVLINYGVLEIGPGNFTPKGKIINHGVIIIQDGWNINDDFEIVNYDQIIIQNHLIVNRGALFNHGLIQVMGNTQIHHQAHFYNGCTFESNELIINNNEQSYNYGTLIVDNEWAIHNTSFYVGAHSSAQSTMLSSNHSVIQFSGDAGCAEIKTDHSKLNQLNIHGSIGYCELQGNPDMSALILADGAIMSCMGCKPGPSQLTETNDPSRLQNIQDEVQRSIVFPNPSNGKINIALLRHEGPGEILIYDISGQLLSKQSFSAYTRIAKLTGNGLDTGLYVLKIRSEFFEETHKLRIIK